MTNKIKNFILSNWVGIVVAGIVSIIVSAPPVFFRISDEYAGVDMLKTNTETHYVSQIQEVYDGKYSLGNPFLGGELKNTPYLFPPFGPILIAQGGKLFGMSAIEAVIFSRFVLIFLISFFVYYFTYMLTGRRLVGAVASLFVVLGYSLVDPKHILEIFGLRPWSQELTFIDYGRPINPSVSSLFLWGYLVFFWQFLRSDSKKYLGVISSIILGLSFYVYLYTWSFILTLNGFMFLASFFLEKDSLKCKKILLVTLGGLFIGIPYFIHTYIVSLHPYYSESSVRFGFFKSRMPEISRLVVISALLFSVFSLASSKRKMKFVFEKSEYYFFLAFFVTAIIIANQHIFTGLYIFNHHWHWYYNTPLTIVFLVVFLFLILSSLKRPWVEKIFAFLLMALFVYNGLVFQKYSYEKNLSEVKLEQNYAQLFDWINQSEDNKIFLTSRELSSLIPAYTKGDVYYHGTAIYTLISDRQLLDAYLVYAYLEGVDKKEISEYLEKNREDISHFAYGYRFRLKKGVCLGCIPDAIIENMSRTYMSINGDNFVAFIKKYPADFLIWDKLHDPDWKVGKIKLNLIKDTPSYSIYSL